MPKLHINNWINRAEPAKPDYYMEFVKTWIPFNAWYCEEYSTTTDSEALRIIKTTSNKIKNRIEALLTNNDKVAIKFRSDVAHLHDELRQRPLINRGKPVSFAVIKLPEYYPDIQTLHKGDVIYKVIPNSETGHKVIVVASDNSRTFMDKNFAPYSMDALKLDNQFIMLPAEEMRDIVKQLFQDADPAKPFNLIADVGTHGSIAMDTDLGISFKNDIQLIAKSLIQILYELRCFLFHGTLDPTEANHPIYEHAYDIMKTLIKELK